MKSIIGWIKCLLSSHEYKRDGRIEAFTLALRVGERMYRCERCGEVIKTRD